MTSTHNFELEMLDKLQTRASRDIAASPLGVGFETLDRKLFDPDKTYTHLAALGVKWARCQTGWSRCEPVKGQYDFAWLDGIVDALLEIGIQPWFNLGYGNKLYTPEAQDSAAVGWIPQRGEAWAGWLNFTRAIAEHFTDRVRHWEFWNEPNHGRFWKPDEANPAQYAEFVKLTAPEIRQRVPEATIIGGAIAGLPKLDYVGPLLEAGLAEHIDKFTFHPYRAVPEANYESELAALRAALASATANGKTIEVWQGECGVPSYGGGAGALRELDWDEAKQAKWLLRRVLSDLRLGVELTSYYHTVDMLGYSTGGWVDDGKTNPKGLLRGSDYTPKPSYYAYQNLCALFDSETTLANPGFYLHEEGLEVITATFTRRGHPLHLYWHPADLMAGWTPHTVTLSISHDSDRLSEPVLVDLLSGRVYSLDGQTAFSVPLLDYPLLLTDRMVMVEGARHPNQVEL